MLSEPARPRAAGPGQGLPCKPAAGGRGPRDRAGFSCPSARPRHRQPLPCGTHFPSGSRDGRVLPCRGRPCSPPVAATLFPYPRTGSGSECPPSRTDGPRLRQLLSASHRGYQEGLQRRWGGAGPRPAGTSRLLGTNPSPPCALATRATAQSKRPGRAAQPAPPAKTSTSGGLVGKKWTGSQMAGRPRPACQWLPVWPGGVPHPWSLRCCPRKRPSRGLPHRGLRGAPETWLKASWHPKGRVWWSGNAVSPEAPGLAQACPGVK